MLIILFLAGTRERVGREESQPTPLTMLLALNFAADFIVWVCFAVPAENAAKLEWKQIVGEFLGPTLTPSYRPCAVVLNKDRAQDFIHTGSVELFASSVKASRHRIHGLL